ncbi:DoxX family protein [Actinacidiphila soli]|uniref:DoxX family protein n=1 Tax=Actinacidiphila soli TaxID=2487275 RepID=UPI00389965A0
MVKVHSDPAQVIVSHASFRVELGAMSARALQRNQRVPLIPSAVRPSAAAQRRTHVVSQTQTQVMQNVGEPAGATTQVLPRIDEYAYEQAQAQTQPHPTVAGPRRPPSGLAPGEMLGGMRPAHGAFDDEFDAPDEEFGGGGGGRARHADPVKHAWYPGRRMNLGIVLLPLRIFLGFISIYAGMGKLCDPVYFDGGKRGSMVTWLASLHPWAAAEPLRNLALGHPVGAGLTIAFLQVIAGVLTVCGLWQRVAASIGAMLSVALLVTVSWRTLPAYDAPDIIYLAAWSPLVIAGAPVYSVDGRLAGEAWRRLGPRAHLWDLRRRVLRRGMALATVLVGLTLVVGSTLGAAVRSTATRTDLPGPTDLPTNHQDGSPLPEVSGEASGSSSGSPSASHSAGASPSASPSSPSATTGASSAPTGSASQHTGAGGGSGTTPSHSVPSTQPRPTHTAAPTPTTGGGSGSTGGGSSDSGGALGGLLGSGETSGWLLGMPGAPRDTAPSGMA